MTHADDSLTLIDTAGWDIYQGGGYHYGPSFLIHPDTLIEVWTTMPGGSAWDFIHYKKSADKGHTWTGDAVALQPIPGSEDALSNADPGVIRIDSFYYIGYTSTMNASGTDNHAYVARSTNPAGPYQKWNGSGWGGNPAAFIRFDERLEGYGVGEPSFVRKGDTIFIYYTWLTDVVNETRVAIAPATDPDWPGKVVPQGIAIQRAGGGGSGGYVILEDSHDIKYCDSLGLFIGVSVMNRLKADASVLFYFSADGIHFKKGGCANRAVQPYAHNIGISGTLQDGHIDLTYPTFIGYAYGPDWGNWNTTLSPVRIEAHGPFTPPDSAPSGLAADTTFPSGVALSWSALSQDADSGSGIRCYAVYRDGQRIAFTDSALFQDTAVSDSASYAYRVAAVNAFGLQGPLSAEITAVAHIRPIPFSVRIRNPSFESPALAGFAYTPADPDWTFEGMSGIERNGSAFGAANAPDGVQAALLQNGGSFHQSLFFTEGFYSFTFKAAQRSSNQQTISLRLDSAEIGSFTPAGSAFTAFSSESVYVGEGTHVFRFTGMNVSGDNTAFIDSVGVVTRSNGNTGNNTGALADTPPSLRLSPNPFNPSVTVAIKGLGAGAKVTVMDIAGRVIADLTASLDQGRTAWNASGNASGFYLVTVRKDKTVLTQKALLMR